MIINNPDALRDWLSEVLAPLCEADSKALARYVFALLKKDKPVKDLKKTMTEQLDVFLGTETKPFLDRLFSAIASEEYLTQLPVSNTMDETEMNMSTEAFEIKQERECTPPLYENKTKETATKAAEILSNLSSDETQTPKAGPASPVAVIQNSPTKTSDKENQPRESRRRRISLRSRSRSRSRSDDRARRSRSRDRRAGEKRVFRNKSPPPGERRRPERRAAERSPRAVGKNRTKSHSASRSRSCSPEQRKISGSSSPPATEVIAVNNNTKRQRCRDFDEKGYCVRGETCPWDHGVNPVVLEGINNPTLIGMPSHLREYNPDAPELWNRGSGFQGGARNNFPHKSGVVVPGNYTRPPGAGFRPAATGAFPFPINPAATPLQRELISVPVVDANAGGDVSAAQPKRRYEPEDTVAIAEGPAKRKIPINSRLGPRVGPQQNCTLELRKIPRGMNTITHLNNHFSKFGKIVNIQISYEGDPEAATVTFSTHAEANVAYRSTEAVLNNRFIKVFWHSPGSGENSAVSTPKEDIITNGRKQSQYHLNNVVPAVPTPASESAKVNNTATSSTVNSVTTSTPTTVLTATSMVSSSGPVRLKTNRQNAMATNAIIRKKQEDHIKTAVQLAHGLHKRKHELLREYLKEMKAAVDLVEKTDPSDPARAKKLNTIKDLQAIIDKLRKEIATEQVQLSAQIHNQPPAKKTKEQQKKELLDLELELIAQQQEGNDTTAIQKRVEDLQRSLGISSSSATSHNKTHFTRNMRMRNPVPPVSTSFDRRPTTLLISGFDADDSDLLLGHFKHFGEITKHEVDRNTPQLIISYATRLNAEQAVLRGRVFKEKRLQIAWAPTQTKVDHTSTDPTTHKPSSEPVADSRMEDEEEEEDAESEDRSWRR